MRALEKLAIFILLASAMSWPQAQDTSKPEGKATAPPESGSQAEGTATAQSSASPAADAKSAQQTPAASGDSTRLEVLKSEKPPYPLRARQDGIQGQVLAKITVSEQGDVKEVEVLRGDPILAESVVKTIKKWKFKPYIRNGKAVQAVTQMPFDFSFYEKTQNDKLLNDSNTTSVAPRTDEQSTDAGKQPSAGPSSNTGATSAADSAGASSTTSSAGTSSDKEGASPSPGTGPSAAASGGEFPKRVRVMGGVIEGHLEHTVIPVYPRRAAADHIQDRVLLHAVIDKDGRVADLTPISGPQELVQAAIGAVQQWRYRPYILNGQPVEVETTITVNFNLTH